MLESSLAALSVFFFGLNRKPVDLELPPLVNGMFENPLYKVVSQVVDRGQCGFHEYKPIIPEYSILPPRFRHRGDLSLVPSLKFPAHYIMSTLFTEHEKGKISVELGDIKYRVSEGGKYLVIRTEDYPMRGLGIERRDNNMLIAIWMKNDMWVLFTPNAKRVDPMRIVGAEDLLSIPDINKYQYLGFK